MSSPMVVQTRPRKYLTQCSTCALLRPCCGRYGRRDTVQLYAQLRDAGLQYGPSFRLLRNVHVQDVQ